MNYIGTHRDDTPRPRCTCGHPDRPWHTGHNANCAMRIDVRTRLHIGQGGTR